MNRNKHLLFAPLGLLTIAVITGAFLRSSVVNGASASTATAAVKIAASCTLTSTGGGNYSATVPNGTSAEIPGSTLSVSCNDAGGFALYAVGYSNDTIGNNNMIGASTNIATNTSGTDSYWAMKINPTTGSNVTIENNFDDNTNFHIVPNAHTKVASYASSTGTGSLSVKATYKANISSTQLAGNYLGKVKYTLIHPAAGPAPVTPLAASDCPALSICYAPNADDIEGTMLGTEFSPVAASTKAGKQDSVSANSTADLRAYNYSRPGYGFAGWSPSYEASTNPGSTDIIYGPQATISTNPSDPEGADVSTNGLILYPVWVASTGSMQTFSSSDCNAMSIGDVTARTDIRDGNTYTIAKLPDGSTGRCWMVENLRLNDDANITTSNTQSNNGAFGGVFTGLAKSENANFDNTTNANSLYSTDGSTANVISDDSSSYWGYRIPRYNNNNINRSLMASYSGRGSPIYYQWYGYGNYYTWSAAIANTIHYSTKNQSITTTSICPTGWHLPTGVATTGEFTLLDIALGGTGSSSNSSTDPTGAVMSSRYRSYPNNFLYSGNFLGSSARGRGGSDHYWSSTVSESGKIYNMGLDSSRVYPVTTSDANFYGYAIRCTLGS